MISIDITVLIHIINMVALMIILNKVLYKPVLDIMDQRQDKLGTLSNDVEKFEKNAKDRQAKVDRKMREANTKAKAALDAARSEAEAAGAEKIAVIRQKADSEKEKELAGLEAQLETVRKELLDNTAGFAQDMAAKILGRSLQA
jgi:F-type H+-transporting ATPase subunit b